ncbi:hypothetical protein KAR91_75425 [Candidatus Pacearchaeota archaeon]|nr:hypothetical protein [Candidatus Pacearchaeota archaeon]
MKPLIETTACNWSVLEEEQLSEGKIVKPMRIGGIASKGNVSNENDRYYKTSLFERESNRLANDVGNGRMVGELDHPKDGQGRLEKNAMKFTKLFMDGDYMKFEAEVLETFHGKELKANLKGGVAVDISTRGFGSTKKEKIDGKMVDVIQEDYELVAIDAVSGHSNLDAEIQYFKEKAETIQNGGDEMKLEELNKKYPELVAAITEEVETRVRKEVTDDLTTKFEAKVIDEIASTRKDMTDEITEKVKTELLPEYEENQVKLAEIADIVGALIESNDTNKTPDEKDERIKALGENLAESDKKLDKLGTELKEARTLIDKSDVTSYLDEALKNEPFKVMLKERLSLCITKKEVDEQLPKERNYVNKILNDSKNPKGKGRVLDSDEDDENTKDQLDEAKRKQRRLAGIQEKPDNE